jgi:hypothetical protein
MNESPHRSRHPGAVRTTRPQVRSAGATQEAEISGRPVSISTKSGLIEIDLRDAFDLFLPEVPEPRELPKPSEPSCLLCIVPAGPPNINPAALATTRGHSAHRAAAWPPWRHWATLITALLIEIAQVMRSAARLSGILIVRALRSMVQVTSLVSLGLRSRTHELAIGIARALRSAAPLAVRIARSIRPMVLQLETVMARALRPARQLMRVAPAPQSGARPLRIRIARTCRAATQATVQLALASGSTAQRHALLPVVVVCVAGAAIAEVVIFRQGPPVAMVQTMPSAQQPAPPTVQASAATSVRPSPPAAEQSSTATRVRPSVLQTLPVVEPARNVADSRPRDEVQAVSEKDEAISSSATATMIRPPKPSIPGPQPLADTRAIQRVLNRYRDAFSILNTSAVKDIWPAVDAKALALLFDRIQEQNFEFHSCRISVADLRAEASCQGSAEYTQVGSRHPRTESRQWQFALRKVNESWLIDAVNFH